MMKKKKLKQNTTRVAYPPPSHPCAVSPLLVVHTLVELLWRAAVAGLKPLHLPRAQCVFVCGGVARPQRRWCHTHAQISQTRTFQQALIAINVANDFNRGVVQRVFLDENTAHTGEYRSYHTSHVSFHHTYHSYLVKYQKDDTWYISSISQTIHIIHNTYHACHISYISYTIHIQHYTCHPYPYHPYYTHLTAYTPPWQHCTRRPVSNNWASYPLCQPRRLSHTDSGRILASAKECTVSWCMCSFMMAVFAYLQACVSMHTCDRICIHHKPTTDFV